MSSKITKVFTGLAGLPVCHEPQKELVKLYGRLLRNLEKLPKESQYRIATENLVKERKKIVESTTNVDEIERKINCGQSEELIQQAHRELELISTMDKYKPWEPLEEKPSADQWKWPL